MKRRQMDSVSSDNYIIAERNGTFCCTMCRIITRLFTQADNLRVDVYIFSNKVNGSVSTQYTYQQSRNVIGKCKLLYIAQSQKGAHDKIRKNNAVPADPGCSGVPSFPITRSVTILKLCFVRQLQEFNLLHHAHSIWHTPTQLIREYLYLGVFT